MPETFLRSPHTLPDTETVAEAKEFRVLSSNGTASRLRDVVASKDGVHTVIVIFGTNSIVPKFILRDELILDYSQTFLLRL